VRAGPSLPWRALRVTAGCGAQGKSRSGPRSTRGARARRRPAGSCCFSARRRRIDRLGADIIDRALAAQALAGTAVTLLTFDTSQAQRARIAELRVNKLTVPIGEEPPDTRGRKARRSPAAGAADTGS
jgi:hypothetical protein